MSGPEPPRLPVRWRPVRGRVVPYAMAVLVVAVMLVVAAVVPEQFQLADRVGLVAVGVAVAAVLHRLGHCRIDAAEHALTVVNIVWSRRLAWPEVIDARMGGGDPWPTLDLADGTTLAAMGIQASDGERAQRAVHQLRALIRARGEAAEP